MRLRAAGGDRRRDRDRTRAARTPGRGRSLLPATSDAAMEASTSGGRYDGAGRRAGEWSRSGRPRSRRDRDKGAARRSDRPPRAAWRRTGRRGRRGARADQHREAQREVARLELERTQPLALLGQQDRGRLADRPRSAAGCCSRAASRPAAGRVRLVDERRGLEEGELQPVAEVGPRPAIGAAPGAHLDADAELERRVRETPDPIPSPGRRRRRACRSGAGDRTPPAAARRPSRRSAPPARARRSRRSGRGRSRRRRSASTRAARRRTSTSARRPRGTDVDLSEPVARDLARHLVVIAERARCDAAARWRSASRARSSRRRSPPARARDTISSDRSSAA